MKDEAKGGVIIEFVGLRPKLYAYAFQGYNSCDKGFERKAKGIKEEVIKKTPHFDFYKGCLFRGIHYYIKHSLMCFDHANIR